VSSLGLKLWALVAVPFALLRAGAQDAPRPSTGEAWRIILPKQATLVLARDGSLIGEIGAERRVSVPLRTLPKYLAQAFIAVEDQRFYEHDGVDLVGIAGAIKDNLMGERRGASTITQLLVGNMHPDVIDRRDKGLGRKLREQAAAREMEKHYSKEQILEAFLNQIHFGHGWYGVEVAARRYFGKPAAKLSLGESATLAALPKGPAIYDPIAHPDRAKQRRNVVLALMAQQGFITREQSLKAQREPMVVAKNRGVTESAPYFIDVVRVQAERLGVPIASGGFQIHTTLEPALQAAAREAVVAGTKELEGQAGYRHPTLASRVKSTRNDYLQALAIAMDPSTGEVRALIGGRDYAKSQFNRAVNGMRQPGSAFKPVVYATALEQGLTPNVIIPDTALAIPLPNGTVYSPKNSDDEFLGPLIMRDALARSRNTVAVQLAQRVTMDSVVAMARRLGIDAPIVPYPSSAIGASVVQPLDLVSVYATIANLGLRAEPRFITRVEDREGRAVWQSPPPVPERVLEEAVAYVLRDMMRDVVSRGTATSVRKFVSQAIPVAGKTGTTDENTDVWFVGMTPEIVAGVWVGFDTPKSIAPGAAGSTLAAPIWGRMIGKYYEGKTSTPWPLAPGVIPIVLDRHTGRIPNPFSFEQNLYTEYFVEGTEPIEFAPWKSVLLALPAIP
jgi:1A family penicillin-binding protein